MKLRHKKCGLMIMAAVAVAGLVLSACGSSAEDAGSSSSTTEQAAEESGGDTAEEPQSSVKSEESPSEDTEEDSESEETAVPSGPLDKVTFGMLKSVNPVFAGIDQGIFAEQGIEVDVQFVASGSDLMPLIASDQLMAGASSPAAGFFNALARGIDVKIVADSGKYIEGHGFGGLVISKAHVDAGDITEPSDLKGTKIGITAEGSAMQLLALQALEKGGLTDHDVELVTMDFPTMVAALESQEIDAAMLNEPFLTQAQKRGGGLLLGADVINPDGQQVVMVYAPAMLADTDLATRFMAGWINSIRAYNSAYDEGGDAAEAMNELQAAHLDLDPSILEGSTPFGLDPNGEPNFEDLGARMNAWVELGQTEKVTPVEEFVDDSFRQEALKTVGEE